MYFADRSCSICVVLLLVFLLVTCDQNKSWSHLTGYGVTCPPPCHQVNPSKDLDAEFDVILAADVIYPTTGGSLPLLLQILS